MAKTVVLGWKTWEPVKVETKRERGNTATDWAAGLTQGALIAYLYGLIEPQLAQADAVPALADSSTPQFSDDAETPGITACNHDVLLGGAGNDSA